MSDVVLNYVLVVKEGHLCVKLIRIGIVVLPNIDAHPLNLPLLSLHIIVELSVKLFEFV